MPVLRELAEQFVEEYLVDLNATKAAIRCGHSPRTAGSIGWELLRKPEISTRIQARRDEIKERFSVTPEKVTAELVAMAFTDATEVLAVEQCLAEDGKTWYNRVTIKPTEDWSPSARAAVSSIKQGANGIEIKFQDKNKALEQLRKHLGMDVERLEISGPNQGPIQLTAEQRKKLLVKAAEYALLE